MPSVLGAGTAGRLRVVANAAVGFDNIDVAAAHELGIAVCNTPGVLDATTADLAFLLILTATRNTSAAEDDLRHGRWTAGASAATSPMTCTGRRWAGRVRAHRPGRGTTGAGFDMEVIHTSRTDTGLPGYVASSATLLARSDIVSLHVPLTESTRHLIGAAELALMKPTAVIVNTAHGPVIDDNALVDALEAGTIYGAGLDVFEGEPT